jgi:hypothetical protein
MPCLALRWKRAWQRAVSRHHTVDPAPSVDLYRIPHFSHLTLLSIKLSVRLTYLIFSKPQTEVQQALRAT